MSKNIYTLLGEINFDKRVKEEIETIKKVRNTNNFDVVMSVFCFRNFVFRLIQDFYTRVLEENNNPKNKL